MVSPWGPLGAQMDWSSGWKSLKQKPSFLEGRSISLHVLRRTVPTQSCGPSRPASATAVNGPAVDTTAVFEFTLSLSLLYSSSSPGFSTHHTLVQLFSVPRTASVRRRHPHPKKNKQTKHLPRYGPRLHSTLAYNQRNLIKSAGPPSNTETLNKVISHQHDLKTSNTFSEPDTFHFIQHHLEKALKTLRRFSL